MSMIDRYQLRYFLAVVETGNFSRAAAQVNVAQPTLSIGIGKLERHLGTKLFFRNSQRVQLTGAGSRFLAHARAIENEFNQVDRTIGGLQTPRLVRLGVITTVPTALVEEIMRAFAHEPRHARIEIVEGTERDLLARLERGRIDLALSLSNRSSTRLRTEALFRESYTLAVASRHRLASCDVVAGEALAEETMIVRRHCEALSAVSRHFTDRGVRPHFSFRSTNDDRVLSMVRVGLGITVMPECFRSADIARPKLADFDLQREIGLLYGRHFEESDETGSSLVNAIRTVARGWLPKSRKRR